MYARPVASELRRMHVSKPSHLGGEIRCLRISRGDKTAGFHLSWPPIATGHEPDVLASIVFPKNDATPLGAKSSDEDRHHEDHSRGYGHYRRVAESRP